MDSHKRKNSMAKLMKTCIKTSKDKIQNKKTEKRAINIYQLSHISRLKQQQFTIQATCKRWAIPSMSRLTWAMALQRLNQLLRNHVMREIVVLCKREEKRKRRKLNRRVRANFWHWTTTQTTIKVTRVIIIKTMIMVAVEVLAIAVEKAMKVATEEDT